MRRCSQQWHLQRAIKRKRANALRRSRLGVAAKAAKRLANPSAREPELVPFYPIQLGVRDTLTGETAWVTLRSGRDAARRIAVVLRFYQPGKGLRARVRRCMTTEDGSKGKGTGRHIAAFILK